MFYVYVLKSPNTDKLYKGQTDDLSKRLKQHNSGKVKFTKAYIPWEIIYFEELSTREEAVVREKFLKSGIGREFLKKKFSEG
jgi:putative endonuclease